MALDVPQAMDFYEDDEAFIEVIDLCTEKPKVLMKRESIGSEKQISVDPISLREPPPEEEQTVMIPLLPLRGSRTAKFVSQSLPNSVSSSPRFASSKKNSNSNSSSKKQPSLSAATYHSQDSIALANLERLREIHLHRSKSCGEGRASAPPEDFDLWLASKVIDDVNKHHDAKSNWNVNVSNNDNYSRIDEREVEGLGRDDQSDPMDEKFKCKALCLYLPAFSKGVKQVRTRRQASDMSQAKESETGVHVVSRRVSLEKFDCGLLMNDDNENEEEDEFGASSNNLFFDLPLELIRCSINDDTHSPVTTAFVFDKEPKGVLKNHNKTTSKPPLPSKSSVSSVSRHVRFSTSSPTSCITPRGRDARDDFSAFLEAQSA